MLDFRKANGIDKEVFSDHKIIENENPNLH